MIDRFHGLPVSRQAQLLALLPSTVYYPRRQSWR